MIKVPLYSPTGQEVEALDVDEARLGGEVKRDVLRQAVVAHEANQRAGTAKVKTRAEIAHPNAKLRMQKHTGRARVGSANSPVRVGGGRAHGPAPRDYRQKVNRKMRRQAIKSALLAKMQDGQVKVVEEIEIDEPKTQQMTRLLAGLGVDRSFLLVLAERNRPVWLSARNIKGSAVMTAAELNAYELIKARDVVFTRRAFDLLLSAVDGSPEQVQEPPAQEDE